MLFRFFVWEEILLIFFIKIMKKVINYFKLSPFTHLFLILKILSFLFLNIIYPVWYIERAIGIG